MLISFFLDIFVVLSFGIHSIVFSFCLTFCVCFYELNKIAVTPNPEKVAWWGNDLCVDCVYWAVLAGQLEPRWVHTVPGVLASRTGAGSGWGSTLWVQLSGAREIGGQGILVCIHIEQHPGCPGWEWGQGNVAGNVLCQPYRSARAPTQSSRPCSPGRGGT